MDNDNWVTEDGLYFVSHREGTHLVDSKQMPGEQHSVAYSDSGKRTGRSSVTLRKASDAEIAQASGMDMQYIAGFMIGTAISELLRPYMERAMGEAGHFLAEKAMGISKSIASARRKNRDKRTTKKSTAAKAQVADVKPPRKDMNEVSNRAKALLEELGFESDPSAEASPETLLAIDSAMLGKYWDAYNRTERRTKTHEALVRKSALARCLMLMPLGSERVYPGAERALPILQEDPKLESVESLEQIVPILLDESLWECDETDDLDAYEQLDIEALNEVLKSGLQGEGVNEGDDGNDGLAMAPTLG